MFRTHGTARSDRQNRMLAGYLAFVGGFVNSVGFVLIGTFTSHVTGIVGRATDDFARGEVGAGLAASSMVLAFFAGAFLASVIVESTFLGHPSRAYAVALGTEGLLLMAFATWSTAWTAGHPRLQDAQALLLCMAMGMQNSLVTRLSGAVVRTTHLTGVVTDLGVEGARWFRFWRGAASARFRLRLLAGANAAERPNVPKVLLLLTIAGAFVGGAATGVKVVGLLAQATMFLAAGAVFAFAFWAIKDRDDRKDDVLASRR
jgi:uncharacterized membrane protein YoaK (UPF0700 family)